jgi:DNA-binding LytR/AlgR family response regulator
LDYLDNPVLPARLSACVVRLQRRIETDAQAAAAANSLPHALEQMRALLATAAPAAATPVPRLEVIQAGTGSTVHLVPIDDVLYFEAADKYVRVITAEREHLIRTSLRELLPQLDPQRFWQVHRGTVVQARSIAAATRDEAGKVSLTLRGRPEKVAVSRIYAHRFKAM